MKKLLSILVFCISFFAVAQEENPPSIAMPSNDNTVLIEELINVTEYENYFNNYCKNKVEQAAKENNWDEKKKQEILGSIKFKYFKHSIYNAFASDSKENLNQVIKIFENLNSKRSEDVLKMVPINAMLQFNLEGFTRSLLKGNYIIN